MATNYSRFKFEAFLMTAAVSCITAFGAVPEAYRQVEWIQSTGKQWIDTGVTPGTTTAVEMDFQLSAYDNVSYIFGTEAISSGYSLETRNVGFMFYGGGGKNLLAYSVGSDYHLSIVPGEGSNGTATLTNITSGACGSMSVSLSNTSSKTLALFALNGGTKFTRYRLRRMTISQEGQPVRNFIPVVNRLTRLAGLYDTVGGEFYANDGTGNFGIGPEVMDETSVQVESTGFRFADGNGLPAYGTTAGHLAGERISLAAPQKVVYNGIDVFCRGWRRYNAATGALIAESDQNTVCLCEFDFDVASRIVWRWQADGVSSATITFSGIADGIVLTNFPTLVALDSGCGFDPQCGVDGVRFTLGDSVELPSECIEWNQNGISKFWVRVPVLRKNNKIKAEWGNGVKSSRGQIARVWEDGYVGVYGLEQSSGRMAIDDTANLMLGSASSAPAEVDGIVGKARLFNNTDKNYFSLGSTQRTPNLYLGSTLECWFKYDSKPSGDTPFLMYYPTFGFYNYGIDMLLNSSGGLSGRMGYNGYGDWVSGGSAAPSAWHHVMIAFDSERQLKFYLDGALQGAVSRTSSNFPSDAIFDHQVYAGGRGSNGNNPRNVTLDGALDEIRVSSVPRGPEYAAAVFANVNDNLLFQTVTPGFEGTGESLPAPSQYTFSVASGNGGTVSTLGNVAVAAGGSLHLTATPADATTAFYAWEGDVATQQIFTASIDLPANRDRSVRAVFARAYYVGTDGNDANDGLTRATAKAKISAAVAAIDEYPAVVLVDDGVYPIGSGDTVTLTNRVAVRALNQGWKASVNLMRAGGRRAFKLTSVGAVLDGLVITNAYGNGWNNNGLCADIDAGHVQNCLFGFGQHGSYHCVDVYLRKGWVINSTFTHDVMGGSGWGVGGSLWATAGLVDSCVFSNNNWQAGICIAGSAEMHNSLVVNNTANDSSYARGGGVFLGDYANPPTGGGGRGYLVNCTIADNYSKKYGGGVFSPGAASGFIVNCAFGGNTVPEAANGVDFYGNVLLLNSLSAYCSAEPGCKVGSPTFTDAENGDYSVTGVSSTRDIGLVAGFAAQPGAKDIAGNARVIGKSVDAGCFEFVPGEEEFAINVEASVLSGEDSLAVDFSVLVAGSENVSYSWDFGDGTTSTAAAPNHEYTQPGYYTVRVVVTNEDSDSVPKESLVFEQENMIKVGASVIYVVENGASTPTPPYATWETAANTLLDAYSLAPSKAIVMGEGRITGGGELNIEIPIRICGQGPDKTTIDASAGRINLNVPGVVLADTAVVNAPAAWNAGHVNTTPGTVISNCVVSGGFSYNSGVIGMNGGTLVDSVLRNFKDVNGCAGGIRVNGGDNVVDRCVISNCVSDLTGGNHRYGYSVRGVAIAQEAGSLLVRNSLLCDNIASAVEAANKPVTSRGGAVYANNAVFESCTISGNVVSNGTAAGVWFYGDNCSMVNTIVAANRTANTNGEGAVTVSEDNLGWDSGKTVDFSHCCVPELAGVATCVGSDPSFNLGKSPLRPYWSLSGHSPCRNAGVKLDWMEYVKDIAGNPRLLGRKPDIGCYECELSSFMMLVR